MQLVCILHLVLQHPALGPWGGPWEPEIWVLGVGGADIGLQGGSVGEWGSKSSLWYISGVVGILGHREGEEVNPFSP